MKVLFKKCAVFVTISWSKQCIVTDYTVRLLLRLVIKIHASKTLSAKLKSLTHWWDSPNIPAPLQVDGDWAPISSAPSRIVGDLKYCGSCSKGDGEFFLGGVVVFWLLDLRGGGRLRDSPMLGLLTVTLLQWL